MDRPGNGLCPCISALFSGLTKAAKLLQRVTGGRDGLIVISVPFEIRSRSGSIVATRLVEDGDVRSNLAGTVNLMHRSC